MQWATPNSSWFFSSPTPWRTDRQLLRTNKSINMRSRFYFYIVFAQFCSPAISHSIGIDQSTVQIDGDEKRAFSSDKKTTSTISVNTQIKTSDWQMKTNLEQRTRISCHSPESWRLKKSVSVNGCWHGKSFLFSPIVDVRTDFHLSPSLNTCLNMICACLINSLLNTRESCRDSQEIRCWLKTWAMSRECDNWSTREKSEGKITLSRLTIPGNDSRWNYPKRKPVNICRAKNLDDDRFLSSPWPSRCVDDPGMLALSPSEWLLLFNRRLETTSIFIVTKHSMCDMDQQEYRYHEWAAAAAAAVLIL